MSEQSESKPPSGLGRTFTNVFSANLASSLGDGIARTAMPLLAARLTDDPLLISGLAALAMLPWLFFAIPAGILIDRVDRRHALAAAQAVRTILAVTLILLVTTETLTIWWLYLIIFIYGMFETVYDGAIRAVIPSIVAKRDLPRANSLIEGGELVVQNFISGPLTSAVFALAVVIPLGINGLVFALAGALALFLPKVASGRQFTDATDATPRVAWYRQLVDGWRFIVSNSMLLPLWIFSIAVGIVSSAGMAVLVLFVLDRLDVPEAFFGLFLLSGAVGGILGSVLTERIKRAWGTGRTMAVMSLISGASMAFIGFVPSLWAAILGFAVTSGAITVWNILVMSLRQSVIPGRLLGRVHGTWRTLLWGTMPIGSLIGGLLGRIDLAVPFIFGGLAEVVLVLFFFRFLVKLPNPEDIDNGD